MLKALGLINLFVGDVARSRHFYCDVLGVPVANPTSLEPDKYLQLGIAGPTLYLHWTPPGDDIEFRRRGVELFFEVDDVDALAAALKARGVPIKLGPAELEWRSWRYLAVEDPDGYILYLYTPTT